MKKRVLAVVVIILIAVLGGALVMAQWSGQPFNQKVSGELFAQAIPAPENFALQGNAPENLTITTTSFQYIIVLKNPNSFPVSYEPNLTVTLSSESTGSIMYDSHIQLSTTQLLQAHSVTEVYRGVVSIPNSTERGKYLFQATGASSGPVTLIGEQMVLTLV